MTALLSCAHCGGSAFAHRFHNAWIAECYECGLELQRDTEAEAIAAWNNRQPRPAYELAARLVEETGPFGDCQTGCQEMYAQALRAAYATPETVPMRKLCRRCKGHGYWLEEGEPTVGDYKVICPDCSTKAPKKGCGT